jgi:hypothetical protein
MRHGEYIVFAEDAIDDPDIIERLNLVSHEKYLEEMNSWKERTDEHVKRYQYKRNPAKYLKKVEDKWLN